MMSTSYTNLLGVKRKLSKTVPVPGNKSELDDDQAHSVSSSSASSFLSDRVIIVAKDLPLKAKRREDNTGWSFSLNEDSLLLQLKDGLPEDMEVLYIGSLNVNVDPKEQNGVSKRLKNSFNCIPTFLPPDLMEKFYDGFCKRHLWPLFHNMSPFSADQGDRFDRSLWEAYVLANNMFYKKVIQVLTPDDDYVWIHDYHLMLIPSFLRRRSFKVRMGFFLHSPFPSSEIYRTFPVREEILKALLNSDVIGFHTFDYARHFLSCCSRMLGLDYQLKRGYLELEYYGRAIGIKIAPVGIHKGRIESVMKVVNQESSLRELRQQFEGKMVLLGVDDIDIFKGINFKLLAMEQMLKRHSNWRGRAVLIQILNPARGKGINIEKIQEEIQESFRRINEEFGQSDYKPIVLINSAASIHERVAYYSIADCVVVTAVRDGMNPIPYEYIVCRQGISGSSSCSDYSGPKKSMLVLSEFIGCSASLSGAIRINPWNVEATAEAMHSAISMGDSEKQVRHENHYRYVSTHDVAYWSHSFWEDLEGTCADHFMRIYWGTGFSFGFRVVGVDPSFRKLSKDEIQSAYCKATRRAILLDYDGTMMPQNSINKSPSLHVVSILKRLCADRKNTVFIVSGRERDCLNNWFSLCPSLGIAAEHGYFFRWPHNENWEICGQSSGFGWKKIVEPVMRLYTDATHGSSIETKESALVWQYRYANPDFGSSQAKEMLDHLESFLANEPVVVKRGKFIVEVEPQGVSKGLVAEKIFKSMAEKGGQADFVLCIGDDRSDEDMFEIFGNATLNNILFPDASIFTCTVERKPSKATYFLDNTTQVMSMLESLAGAFLQREI